MTNSSSHGFQASILVVDDLPDNLRMLQEAISGLGYRVRCARSGALALSAAQADVPDLVLLDVKMPVMDGYEVCKRLKSHENTCDVPVIFLSANNDLLDKVKAFEVGGADYITKPFLIDEVVVRIRHQIALKIANQQVKQANEVLEQRVQERTALLDQEIIERKQAQQIQQQYLVELQDWRTKYEQAGLLSGQILFEWDLRTNLPTWGANTAKILGYSLDEMPKVWDEWVNLIHPEDQPSFVDKFTQKSDLRIEFRIRHGNGSYIWVEDKTHLFQDQQGNPERLIGFLGEITDRKKAELAIRESEARFRLLSELAPIGIFYTDCRGKNVYENPFLEKMLALPTTENSSQSWVNHIHPEDQSAALDSFQDSVQNASQWSSEFRLVNAEDQVYWVLGQATPIVDETREPLGFVGILSDITAQKLSTEALQNLNEYLEQRVAERTSELQQSNLKLRVENTMRKHHIQERQRAEFALSEVNDQLQAVLDAVPGCVAWVSADLTYLGVNQLMAKIFGCMPNDFVGQNAKTIQNVDLRLTSFIEQFFKKQQEYLASEIELLIDQESKYYMIVAQQYLQGQAAVFVGVDITDRKQAEIEIQKALQQAQDLSELKSRFISITSHEFRTPLTSIFSASELLEHYGEQWPRMKELRYLKQIQRSVQHMIVLLDDVLIISAGEAGKLKLDPTSIDIVTFCEMLVEEIKLSRNCEHILNFVYLTEQRIVQLDEKLMRHILSNLLSNAVKYSPKEMPVDFNLTIHNSSITFRIKDRGIGIPEADQAHLFDLFHRAENVGTIPGTGLGLSIVKKAVELHQGTIDFKSEVGEGTEFIVSIPISNLAA